MTKKQFKAHKNLPRSEEHVLVSTKYNNIQQFFIKTQLLQGKTLNQSYRPVQFFSKNQRRKQYMRNGEKRTPHIAHVSMCVGKSQCCSAQHKCASNQQMAQHTDGSPVRLNKTATVHGSRRTGSAWVTDLVDSELELTRSRSRSSQFGQFKPVRTCSGQVD